MNDYNFIGNYSCLLGQLHLQRSLGFHMVQSYLPTILIVVISWVSFWMDVDSVAGRTTLGVTTLLTVSSKSSGKWVRMIWFTCIKHYNEKQNTNRIIGKIILDIYFNWCFTNTYLQLAITSNLYRHKWKHILILYQMSN